jgi:hypothetical protein
MCQAHGTLFLPLQRENPFAWYYYPGIFAGRKSARPRFSGLSVDDL